VIFTLTLICSTLAEDYHDYYDVQTDELRKEKSLLNTFPFNHADDGDQVDVAGVDEASEVIVNHENLEPVANRQGYGPPIDVSEVPPKDPAYGIPPNDEGKRCVDKVEMIEETIYDEVINCDHSYDRQCHTSYTTVFDAQQEEECEENYIKRCYIAYENFAFNETVKVCRTPLVKDCDIPGEPVCRTVYESECWTKQHEHAVEDDVADCVTVIDEKCEDEVVGYTTQTKCHKWPRQECTVSKKDVKKYSPVTGCTKEPRELCAPAGCGFKPSPDVCHDKVKTIVQEKPTEECDIEPHRMCKHVTKLVPHLEPREECVDVPKEVCTRARANPRKIKKPVIKKWCYIPSEESGLA